MKDRVYKCPWCPNMSFLTAEDLSAHLKAAVARVPAFNAPAVNPTDHKYYYTRIHREAET